MSDDKADVVETKEDSLDMSFKVSPFEFLILRDAVSVIKSVDAKWHDARGQGGPAPADLGVHDPIPLDAVCASVVVSPDKDG